MLWQVDVVDVGRIEVDRVEPVSAAVDHLQSGALLHREIDQQGPVGEFGERFERHEFVVGFRRPRVYLYTVLEGYH